MRRLYFIVNPRAAAGRAERAWDVYKRGLETSGGSFGWSYAEGAGHGEELARWAARRSEGVVAVGGDGTVQEVACGLLGSDAALGVVPAGTGNDFARSAGLVGGAWADPAWMWRADPVRIDVGKLNGKLFLNVAGVGFDAEVARRVAGRRGRRHGTLTYLVEALRLLPVYRNPVLRIVADGRVIEGPTLLLAAGNGRFYGGGMMICPDAGLDDGFFDVCLAGDLGRAETLLALVRVYGGRHLQSPKFQHFRTRRLRIEGPPTVAVHADGELAGFLPVDLELEPQALSLLAPSGAQRVGARVRARHA